MSEEIIKRVALLEQRSQKHAKTLKKLAEQESAYQRWIGQDVRVVLTDGVYTGDLLCVSKYTITLRPHNGEDTVINKAHLVSMSLE